VSSGAFALIAGIVYTLLGIAGLFPAASGYLGLFPMNVPLSVLHLVVGVCGLAAASVQRYGRQYARGVAVILGVLGAMGLIPGLNSAFGLMPLHSHNVWLHLGTTALAAYFGWRAQIPVLSEELREQDRRDGTSDRRETITTVSRERRHGAYDRRTPLGA
jgi:uncharacterized membrane protein YfcA